MARSVNKVILIGNLGRDPELRYTPSGTPVANFTIATSDRRKTQDGQWEDQTEWHNLVCWGRRAEVAGEYLRKGSKVYIEGKLRTRSWEQDGQKRYRTEIWVDDFLMLDSRGAGPEAGGEPSGFEPDQISDDDIPF